MSYLPQAQQAVQRLHKCTAVHVETVRVRHTTGREVICDADVEVFALDGSHEADCCYVWAFENEQQPGKLEVVSVPATSGMTTPSAAVLAVVDWEKRYSNGRRLLSVPTNKVCPRGSVR
jgi:hypothetical protein